MPKRITKEQILDAAIDVLLERGYTNATTKDLAERAEMSEVTLFRRFGNKAKLAVAAVQYAIDKQAFEVSYTGDIEADILSILAFYQRHRQDKQVRLLPLILNEIPRHPELREAIEAPFARVGQMVALLQRYQQEGILRTEPPMHAVASLIGPLILLKMLEDAVPGGALPPFDLDNHMQAFLYGRRATTHQTPEETVTES